MCVCSYVYVQLKKMFTLFCNKKRNPVVNSQLVISDNNEYNNVE